VNSKYALSIFALLLEEFAEELKILNKELQD